MRKTTFIRTCDCCGKSTSSADADGTREGLATEGNFHGWLTIRTQAANYIDRYEGHLFDLCSFNCLLQMEDKLPRNFSVSISS